MQEIRPYKESLSELFNSESKKFYFVPAYQRAYSWYSDYWETLFNDIDNNDNDYFVGTIITIAAENNTNTGTFKLEVLDGQQRITTFSLLLLSLYSKIKNMDLDADSEYDNMRRDLRRKFIVPIGNEKCQRLRLLGNDNDLFRELLRQNDLLACAPIRIDNRRKNLIVKAYKYFCSLISDCQTEAIFALIKKVLSCTFIRIELDNRADAYLLFESLNGKSLPLTIVDLLKIEYFTKLNNGSGENEWEALLKCLDSDESARHIQFILNNYRAFAKDLGFDSSAITKASALKKYKDIFDKKGSDYIHELIQNAEIFTSIVCPDKKTILGRELSKIEKLGITQAYPFFMYMMKNHALFSEAEMVRIVQNIGAFFVRRNISNFPQARDVSHMFLECIRSVETPNGLLTEANKRLQAKSITDEQLKAFLAESDVYSITGVAKYLLSGLENEMRPTPKGIHRDFDDTTQGQARVWQIEHILPQDENLNDDWLQMLGNGDKAKAEEIQEKWLHNLGNLTLTAYNPELGSASFEDKKTYIDPHGTPTGLNNGLWLNDSVVSCSKWTEAEIKARRDILIDAICAFIQYKEL